MILCTDHGPDAVNDATVPRFRFAKLKEENELGESIYLVYHELSTAPTR